MKMCARWPTLPGRPACAVRCGAAELPARAGYGRHAGRAQTAARLALAAGTDLIIGPLFATSVQAVAPVLANARVPALALSNDRSVASKISGLGFIPEDNIDRAIAQTIGQGLTRFGALCPMVLMANAGARAL